MSERTFKLTVSEEELRALIVFHCSKLSDKYLIGTTKTEAFTTELTARIHDLTKRLNKNNNEAEATEAQPEPEAKVEEKQIDTSGW